MTNVADLRARMVERQLRGRGIEDERVLDAMGEVPRERFVPAPLRSRAYADSALPIGGEQTISQPWIVAAICQALELWGGERVLEVGTGSGYSSCVLSKLARQVVSLERDSSLAIGAHETLIALGVDNVEVLVGDGSLGLPGAPAFDAIAVHAAAPAPPPALVSQLAEDGRMVIPITGERAEELILLRRRGEGIESGTLGPCRFVPLLGAQGYRHR